MTSVFVDYKAFGSNLSFVFTGENFLSHNQRFDNLTDEEVLEFVFRQCNHVDGDEWISQNEQARSMRLRSMSVGDIVSIARDRSLTRYTCEPIGWKKKLTPTT